jgi:hypothetical protein
MLKKNISLHPKNIDKPSLIKYGLSEKYISN